MLVAVTVEYKQRFSAQTLLMVLGWYDARKSATTFSSGQ